MASLYRLTAGALLDVTPRRFAPAFFSHSAIKSAATLSAEPFATTIVPEIFDIFDAPVKLRERVPRDGPSIAVNRVSTARPTSRAYRSNSTNVYNDPLGLPWSLPPPVVFDGPACPPHMSLSILKRRRLQRRASPPSPRGDHGYSTVSCSALTSQSEPLYEVFDGPSRITRYQYPRSYNEGHSFTYLSLALCISSTLGWLALKDNLDSLRQINAGSS